MTIAKYIENLGGTAKASRFLGISRVTLTQWAKFQVLPSDKRKRELVLRTGGAISYADIIDPFFRSKTPKKSKHRVKA